MTDTGRSPDGTGSRASHEAAKASSPKASIPNAARPTLHGWQFYWMRWSFGWQSYPDNSIKAIHHLLIFVGPLQLWFYV